MTRPRLLDEDLPTNELGEGAFWDADSAALYWVDINGQAIFRYDVRARAYKSWKLPKQVSFAFPTDGRVVVCLSDGVYDLDPADGTLKPVALLDLPSDHRLNDGKLDPRGRLWVGTINTGEETTETAALYRLDDDRIREIEPGYVNANGKAWSKDGRTMYHADTARGTIWQYDYDLLTGEISGKRVFVKKEDWHPDGLCSDGAGLIFAAIYGGSRIDVFDYRGDIQRTIDLPVPNPTSCAIGGDANDQLFVTSASEGMTSEDLSRSPLSGQVFIVDLDR